MGELANLEVLRITDKKVLDAPRLVTTEVRASGAVSGAGSVYIVNHNADNELVTLRYRLRDLDVDAAEEPFQPPVKV